MLDIDHVYDKADIVFAGHDTRTTNSAPTCADGSLTTNEDTSAAAALSCTDADVGDSLDYSIVSGPSHGSLSGTAPNLTYIPAANYSGSDSFTFKANDGAKDSNVATFSITVTSVNDAPVAVGQTVTTNEDVPVGITLSATDADGNPLTYSIVSSPSHGTLSGTPPNVTYSPSPSYNGSDSFTFKANDGASDSNNANVSLSVVAVNDAPTAQAQSVTTSEGVPVGITLSATDPDNSSLTYAIVASPSHGTLSGTPPNLTYSPVSSYNGPDSFTFKASDGTVDSNTALVSISVTPVNNAPVAIAQSVTTPEDTPKAISLQATDSDGNALTYAVVDLPSHGSLSGSAPNLTYTPSQNYYGPDSFTFKAGDGTVDSNTATVSISVTPVNDVPNVRAWTLSGNTEGTTTPQLIFGTFTDPDAQAASSYSATVTWGDGSSSTGSISFASNRYEIRSSHTYKRFGNYTITVRVVDSQGGNSSDQSATKIADAPLTGTKFSGGRGTVNRVWGPYVMACVADANPLGVVGDISATIKWGDGSSGTLTMRNRKASDPCPSSWDFVAVGSHTYKRRGTFTYTVTFRSVGGSTATATGEVVIS
jgi:hypothetical protein